MTKKIKSKYNDKKLLDKIEELASIGYPQVLIERALGLPVGILGVSKIRNSNVRRVFIRAREKFIQFHLSNIETHAIKDWRASKYQLEIHDPEHFSERRKLELTGKDGQPVGVVVVKNYGGKK